MAAGWAAAVLLAAVGGFLVTHRQTPQPQPVVEESAELDLQLARELRVLENRRLYDHVEDMEFLKGLDHPDLFGDDS
jgi:hypothetical protein